MFVSQAHSFRQQARLAVTLAWVGGYTNIVTLIACGTATSHVTGTTSGFGRDVFAGMWGQAAFAGFLLVMFFIGAGVSGFCTELGRRRGWESIYVLPMMVEATLLAFFAGALEVFGGPEVAGVRSLYYMTGLAAAAMGLQNATITQISSGQVRTTHVTGVLTDLGQELVQFVWWVADRRRNVPPVDPHAMVHSVRTHPTARRLVLLAAIFGTFALGAGLGTLAYEHMPRWAMFPPVFFLCWIVYQDVAKPIAEIEAASELAERGTGLDLPAGLAVFHLRKDHDREGRVHRMPNLSAWAERLPATTRVVVLDLGEVTLLDANAILELRGLMARFAGEGREMVIAGIDQVRYRQMHLEGAGEIRSENLCPDLELAIARGMNVLVEGIERRH